MATSRSKFDMNQEAGDRSAEVTRVYGVPLSEIGDPVGYAFDGRFHVPVTGNLFLTRAREVAEKTDRMTITGPRLILCAWNEKRYVPVSDRAQQLIRDGFVSALPPKVCSDLAGVSTRTVITYYDKFEMEEWRREKVNDL